MKIEATCFVADIGMWFKSARWVIVCTSCRSLYCNHDFFRQKNTLTNPNLMEVRILIHFIRNITKQCDVYWTVHLVIAEE